MADYPCRTSAGEGNLLLLERVRGQGALLEKGRKMKTQEKTLEQVLEQGCERFPKIINLYEWSLNYRAGEGPVTLFLDLIGYSMEEFGETLYDPMKAALGYLELDYLGDALKEYATIGQDAYDFTMEIVAAEGRE